MYDRFQISFNNYLTKLDDLKESYDQFIIAHNQYKADKENTLNPIAHFLIVYLKMMLLMAML